MSDAEKENVIGREEEEAMDINQDVEVIQATVPNLCFAFLPKFFFELDHRIRAFNTQTCIPIGQLKICEPMISNSDSSAGRFRLRRLRRRHSRRTT